jgi:hypothetical protein
VQPAGFCKVRPVAQRIGAIAGVRCVGSGFDARAALKLDPQRRALPQLVSYLQQNHSIVEW